ncbi:MAG TPA: phage BR0599 family protein, partial [Alphaproteobacteria bacterium]|nr:phage BR0599 family protein [Alphaproteobacteria bacterium]
DAANFADTSRGEGDGSFDGGLLTWTSGANVGFAVEIKTFAAQAFSLWLSAPYAIEAGDEYSATPGCDKRFSTCKNRYGRAAHFGGFPYLPGLDKILDYPNARGG